MAEKGKKGSKPGKAGKTAGKPSTARGAKKGPSKKKLSLAEEIAKADTLKTGKKKKPAAAPAASAGKKTALPPAKNAEAALPAPEAKEGGTKTGTFLMKLFGRKPAPAGSRQVAVPDDEEPVEVDPEALERGDEPMTLVDHLAELRSRLIIIAVTLIIAAIVGFYLSDYLLKVVQAPFVKTGQKLNLFTLMEGVMLRLKAGFFASLLLCIPLLIYHAWKYMSPAIDRQDRFFVKLVIIAALFLFYGGVYVTYVFLPMVISALIAFAPEGMQVMNNASEYFSFFIFFCFMMGLVSELPIIILILTRIGLISPSFLVAKRKYAVVVIWIAAALITPTPDPLTMSMVAVPLMLLYEVSIFVSRFVIIRKKKRDLLEQMENA